MTITARKIAAALAAPALATITVAGLAAANRNTPDADCSGFTFLMPATEDGTTIVVTRNGVEEYRQRNEVFGTRYEFSIPSPDRTVTQTWRVVVAGFNGTSTWSETVAPCVTPSSTTTSSTVPSTTTTTTTTTVAVTTPPVPSSTTTVAPPRATTTSTVASGPALLPATA